MERDPLVDITQIREVFVVDMRPSMVLFIACIGIAITFYALSAAKWRADHEAL
jgi:hypothetical protein